MKIATACRMALVPAVCLGTANRALATPPLRLLAESMAGWQTTALDVTDGDAVFAFVWQHLPDDVDVFPTENYTYWQLSVDGREVRGNFRLAPGDREHGRLHFAYSEWEEFATDDATRAGRLKHASVHNILSPGADSFEWTGRHGGKSVRFHLHRLEQRPPTRFALRHGERFVQRTADESGLQFFLLFNDATRSFHWLLDEEAPVPEHWRSLGPRMIQGRRTGFLFRIDGPRKELAAVRAQSVDRNDFCDGPFDQLADNTADASPLRECLEKSDPSLVGGIDSYGRFTDDRRPRRVAIAPYLTYRTQEEAVAIAQDAAGK